MSYVAIFIVAMIVFAFESVTLAYLWGWFVAPLFHLPTLAMGSACGMVLILIFTRISIRGMPKDDDECWVMLGWAVIVCATVLCAGWLVNRWML